MDEPLTRVTLFCVGLQWHYREWATTRVKNTPFVHFCHDRISGNLSLRQNTVTSATTYPVNAAVQETPNFEPSCECSLQEHEENRFFNGILVAVPTGLALWVGLLKVATIALRHY